jgi:peroxiredoxin
MKFAELRDLRWLDGATGFRPLLSDFASYDSNVLNLVRKFSLVTVAAMLVLIVAACSSDSEPAQTPSPASTEGLSAGVEKSDKTATPKPSPTATPSLPFLPVFSVSTIDGENIRLEDLVGTVPVYMLFIPGTVDELDRSQMQQIQARHEVFEQLDAKVVVIVAGLPTKVLQMRDDLGLQFPLIADPLHVIAADWQVFGLENDGKVSPASFVFDSHGNLVARSIASEPEDRPSIDEVLYIIEESLSTGAA